MRIDCPNCGMRDSGEFTYLGAASLMNRPTGGAGFHAYVNLRDNPAGEHAELWQHSAGCRAWLRVVRNVSSHRVLAVELAREVAR